MTMATGTRLLLYVSLLAACTPPGVKTGNAGDKPPAQPANEAHCYLQLTQNPPMVVDADTFPGTPDSLYIHLDLVGDLANGVYNWLPGEKDQMTGTFVGNREGALITALYTYHAEGMTGKIEVIFRMEQGGMRVGQGEMTGDSIQVFKDKSKVTFSELIPEVPCQR